MDRRRRQWIPLDATFAFGKTGTRLKEKFGRDGLLVWVCFLAACKRSWVQGQFEYTSEPDGWNRLGLYECQPDFTLRQFFSFTGKIKQTSRKTHGTLNNVVCTRWGDWNDEIKRYTDADRNRRKRATNTATKPRRNGDGEATIQPTDVDVEFDVDLPPYPLDEKQPSNPRALGTNARAQSRSPVKQVETFIRNGGYQLTDDSLRDEIRQHGINGDQESMLVELAHGIRHADTDL